VLALAIGAAYWDYRILSGTLKLLLPIHGLAASMSVFLVCANAVFGIVVHFVKKRRYQVLAAAVVVIVLAFQVGVAIEREMNLEKMSWAELAAIDSSTPAFQLDMSQMLMQGAMGLIAPLTEMFGVCFAMAVAGAALTFITMLVATSLLHILFGIARVVDLTVVQDDHLTHGAEVFCEMLIAVPTASVTAVRSIWSALAPNGALDRWLTGWAASRAAFADNVGIQREIKKMVGSGALEDEKHKADERGIEQALRKRLAVMDAESVQSEHRKDLERAAQLRARQRENLNQIESLTGKLVLDQFVEAARKTSAGIKPVIHEAVGRDVDEVATDAAEALRGSWRWTSAILTRIWHTGRRLSMPGRDGRSKLES
jgi:hypothetical protein